jgi:hypothetical protein
MRFVSLLVVLVALSSTASAVSITPQNPAPKPPTRTRDRSGDTHIAVETDTRLVAVASALVVAGYSAPGDGSRTAELRAKVLKALEGIPADLRARLVDFYKVNRRVDVDEALDASRYRALALLLNPPPSLSLGIGESRIPVDIRPVKGFAVLAGELQRTSQYRAVLPELLKAFLETNLTISSQLQPIVGTLVDYMHAVPVEEIPVAARTDAEGKILRPASVRIRTLRVYVDPLLGGDAVTVRSDLVDTSDGPERQIRGDRYSVFAGEKLGAYAGLRLGLVRYYLDPLVERASDLIEERQIPINQLIERHAEAKKRYAEARISLVADSLATAADARIRVKTEPSRGIESRPIAEARAEVVARMLLADAYDKGQVLVFHFWDRLKRFEEVGVDIGVVFSDFIDSIDTKNELGRAQEAANVRAAFAAVAKAGPTADEVLAERMLRADQLITSKQFALARPILEEVLQSEPKNARALFGLAQAVENLPDSVEAATGASEDDRSSAQAERLERAVNLYRQAALNSGSRELWIASWSHVYAGRILDFLELSEEANAEYRAAVTLGEVPSGAFREASKRLSDSPPKPDDNQR